MPRGDGTGPWGQGPMTGRGMGYCAGYGAPGFMRPRLGFFGAGRGGMPWGGGRGRAWGGGRGRGWGWTPYPVYDYPFPYGYGPANPEEERKLVSEEIKELEKQIEDLKKYLTDLGKDEKK